MILTHDREGIVFSAGEHSVHVYVSGRCGEEPWRLRPVSTTNLPRGPNYLRYVVHGNSEIHTHVCSTALLLLLLLHPFQTFYFRLFRTAFLTHPLPSSSSHIQSSLPLLFIPSSKNFSSFLLFLFCGFLSLKIIPVHIHSLQIFFAKL